MKTTIGLPMYTITHATLKYAKAARYTSLLQTNQTALYRYLSRGNWVVANENPLVQYLLLLEIDEQQNDAWLYQHIKQRQNSLASLLNFSSLYSKGKNFLRVVFPELNHHTWLCVPFGETEGENHILTDEQRTLRPLTTLYTTDTTFRYDTHSVTRQSTLLPEPTFTLIQIDPTALGIGYARYLRQRINEGINVGLTPHAYVASQVMASFYLQHNLMVTVNLSRQVYPTYRQDKPDWSPMDISQPTIEYVNFLRTTFQHKPMGAYEHYLDQLCTLPEYGAVLKDSLLPKKGLSASFIIMRWIYQASELLSVEGYLDNLIATKQNDALTLTRINRTLLAKSIMLRHIPDSRWQSHIDTRLSQLSEKVSKLTF